ncbi:SGNH hydrolase-type esterase domain-containing protein [Cynara cardunculus var. scolymus]|uniref:SGNH hydrolase-type esterase domain-containing protein n=1 Tax=Cynara cardunculus var. scolymus TaxID=59895 RepID=A0A103XV21_CYNCS|nr:SGNH hydrolase-type esterase domain-containing protein [Cynara cardunculus var. scolymus]
MAFTSSSWSFTSCFVILQLLWSGNQYANGCYTTIISFGDSLADTGNLKQLASVTNRVISVLLPPYGQNFYDQSNGRCSNGCLIIDFLAESLGLPLLSPYVIDKGSDNVRELGHGVNFAVAGATALDSSFLEPRGILNGITNSSLQKLIEMGAQTLVVPGNLPIECHSSYLTSFILMSLSSTLTTTMMPCKSTGSPNKFGFTNGALKACCGGGGPFNYNLLAECGYPNTSVCDRPYTYVSWDGIHLTEAAYRLISKSLFQGPYTTPGLIPCALH